MIGKINGALTTNGMRHLVVYTDQGFVFADVLSGSASLLDEVVGEFDRLGVARLFNATAREELQVLVVALYPAARKAPPRAAEAAVHRVWA